MEIFQGIGAGNKSKGQLGELKLSHRSSEDHTSLNVLDNLFKFFLCEHVEIPARLHSG